MDDSMMMRNIWLKLGLLDTINYKMDATLKKLSKSIEVSFRLRENMICYFKLYPTFKMDVTS